MPEGQHAQMHPPHAPQLVPPAHTSCAAAACLLFSPDGQHRLDGRQQRCRLPRAAETPGACAATSRSPTAPASQMPCCRSNRQAAALDSSLPRPALPLPGHPADGQHRRQRLRLRLCLPGLENRAEHRCDGSCRMRCSHGAACGARSAPSTRGPVQLPLTSSTAPPCLPCSQQEPVR